MKKILMLLISISIRLNAVAQLSINEIMQSNVDCIMDDLYDFPDSWVELFNIGTTPENLNLYRIGLEQNIEEAWQLPEKEVEPGEHILIWCDKVASGFHTNFRLESGNGCNLYLFRNGEIVDKIEKLKKQPAPNIAYGRENDGLNTWGYQETPTPGSKNCGKVCNNQDILGAPLFNVRGCVFTSPQTIKLELSVPENSPSDVEIYYSEDGSEPTINCLKYVNPIIIDGTKIIRAKLFCKGWLSPRSETHSYIYLNRETSLPIISISTAPDYLYDSKIGIIANNQQKYDKYNCRRPINIEFFESTNSENSFNLLGETRVTGQTSREYPIKSLILYANKRFGNNRFKYNFFPDQKPGVTEFKSLVLRNSGNDFPYLYMRDAIIQRVMGGNVDLDWQAWLPVVVYINGAYYGLLNLRERSNEDNVYSNHYGIEDIDVVEIEQEESQMIESLKKGTWDHYNSFKEFYSEYGHSKEEYEERIDIKEYLNLMIMNFYFINQDFPGNNIVLWRPRDKNGKWRFIAKDIDFGLGLFNKSPNYKVFNWFFNSTYDPNFAWSNTEPATRLFRIMIENEEIRNYFIDHAAIYMGIFLNSESIREIWDSMYNKVKNELKIYKEVLGYNFNDYLNELLAARNWLNLRTDELYNHISEYFGLGMPVPMFVNAKDKDSQTDKVQFNGIQLSRGTFNGKFFVKRKINLKSINNNTLCWNIKKFFQDGSIVEIVSTGSEVCLNMPACDSLCITYDKISSSIISNNQKKWSWKIENNQLVITELPSKSKVCLYDASGILIDKVITDNDYKSLALSPSRIYILRVNNEIIKIR